MNSDNKLYRLSIGLYVQHDGRAPLPSALADYEQAHAGELPPYIPLPSGPTVFRLSVGLEPNQGRKIAWDGESPLPDPVLNYVREYGNLPPVVT